MDDVSLNHRARSFIGNLAVSSHNPESQSCTATIYDTAWVSMLSKRQMDGGHKWMFPKAFQFLIDHQGANGGWTICDSKVDTILNTLAALLSMKRHMSNPGCGDRDIANSLHVHVSRAVEYLQRELSDWDPEFDRCIGSDILVPSLLCMLEQENIFFDVPDHEKLMALNSNNRTKFNFEALQGSQLFPMICFLEGFIGIADYKRLNCPEICGSIMSSPSATAGHIMCLQLHNESAESFLRAAAQSIKSEGGVPAVFPCNASEISLVRWLLFSAVKRA